MKELNNKLLIYLNKWIENAKNGNVNDSILCLIENQNSQLFKDLVNVKKIDIYKERKFKKLLNFTNNNDSINKILYSIIDDYDYGFIKRLSNKKFLFIKESSLSGNKELNINEPNFLKHLYIEQIDPYDFLTSKLDYEIMYQIVQYYFDFFTIFLNVNKEIFFKQIDYKESILDIKPTILKQIENELNLFKSKEILTSRLAVFIYRLFSFDIEASTTKIGRYFATKIGTKSKVFTKKTLLDITSTTFIENSMRAYDLLKDEKVENIRKEIARNLLNLEEKRKLDIKTISQVTKLEIEIIKKLNEDILIDKI